jgi:TraY domain-containing protein
MPRKKIGEGKRYPLNMRTTKEMREKLERAAAQSGRSLVQEVEFRLERSFDREEISREMAERFDRLGKELRNYRNPGSNAEPLPKSRDKLEWREVSEHWKRIEERVLAALKGWDKPETPTWASVEFPTESPVERSEELGSKQKPTPGAKERRNER